MDKILKIHSKLKALSTFKFIIVITVISVAIPLFINIVAYLIVGDSLVREGPTSVQNISKLALIITAIIVAPLVETLIFQSAIIGILKSFKAIKDKNILIMFISALAFALNHTYDFLYVLNTFIIGLLFAYSYIIYSNKNKKPFKVVFIIHALRNLSIMLLSGM